MPYEMATEALFGVKYMLLESFFSVVHDEQKQQIVQNTLTNE